MVLFFFFSSRRRHTRWPRDWSSDVCSSDLETIDLSNYLLRSLEKESKEHITVKKVTFTIYPIIAKQFCFGWIVMVKRLEEWQELDDIAIERATSIYAMEFLKKQDVEETKLRIQSNILEDIFSR